MLAGKNLAVLGVGKIGQAIVSGLVKAGKLSATQITGTVAHESSLVQAKKLGITMLLDNKEAIAGRDVIILAVRPQNMRSLLDEIAPVIAPHQLIITIATSVSTSFIEDRLKAPTPVTRAMPNAPALLNVGMTAICSGKYAQSKHVALTEAIFQSVGKTVFVDEPLMDVATALSGSGPAYFYVVIESLMEAGVKLGMPRDISMLLASQTMLGAAHLLLDSKEHPALLKDAITTPAGCTVDGLMELEEGKLRVTLIKAVVKATQRASQLINSSTS